MLGRVKRTTKIPSSFKDFVSSDVQEQPMVQEGMHSVAYTNTDNSFGTLEVIFEHGFTRWPCSSA